MSIITIEQAIYQQEIREDNRKEQIDNFLAENCESYNGRDLQYFADQTGKSIEWIVRNGKNIPEVIKQGILSGMATIEDFWNYTEPEQEPDPYEMHLGQSYNINGKTYFVGYDYHTVIVLEDHETLVYQYESTENEFENLQYFLSPNLI